MREIVLIGTNNVDNTGSRDNVEIYRFNKDTSNEEELKKIVININKSQKEKVCLITNKENLFESFNRNIICEYFDLTNNGRDTIPQHRIAIIEPHFNGLWLNARNIFFNNIEQVLNIYGSIFRIDIKKLIKGTTYKADNKNDLINLISEDLNLLSLKQIITSRLAIIFYRLTYFDLDASKASIGRFFANNFEKSESFKINLNRNSNGWFFTDLNNKIFRGYKIKSPEFKSFDSLHDLKIRIAKNLLRKDVKFKIVAEAVEIEEEELKNIIYKSLPTSHTELLSNIQESKKFNQDYMFSAAKENLLKILERNNQSNIPKIDSNSCIDKIRI